ncbi:MAG: Glu-tRNA(Gln) amidotransferase subunit GatE [Planctomycetes bacterium]|nr:Glu-tRNA(Gln) amidotransferase subunit GatE [Planctomycetota bacterium]
MMPAGFKPFEEMLPEDYASIGLKCGLEVHQQLLTRTKLFCRCPAGRYTNASDCEILRHMRPTLSELGEYDGTALMEKKTRKNIYYRLHHETVCTYEFDDTPPFFPAEDALDIAIELALLLRLNTVQELHIARKQYLDGSIPAGFQRTMIFGVDGWIPYKERKIHIWQLGLEEDSCREVSDVGHDRVYRTDRLGMPLIEVVTGPDMYTPQETAEVGEIIRRLCRSTGKVRTGYGAARQDVNVSVRGGTRIEIKGVPQLWRIPRLIYNEAMRQCALLEIRNELKSRGVTPSTFGHYDDDVTGIVAKTHYGPMHAAVAAGDVVRCVVLKKFAGILNRLTQEHTSFAKELSDRIRVISCLTQLPNMVHSDTASESLYGKDWQKVRKRMKADHDDALVLVWGNERDAQSACAEVAIRAKEAAIGVPGDTRQALKDGTNGFERVLPGAARMYPDTDLPPILIDSARVDRIRATLPPYVWDWDKRCRSLGLNEELLTCLHRSNFRHLFLPIVDELDCDPTFVAVVFCQRLKSFKRRGLPIDCLTDELVMDVFRTHAKGRCSRDGVEKLFQFILESATGTQGERGDVESALSSLGEDPVTDQTLDQQLSDAWKTFKPGRIESHGQRHRFVMGRLMQEYRGRVDGTRLAQRAQLVLSPNVAKSSCQ